MAITNYDFYKNTYYGDSVAESSFPKWESKAEQKLNYLCGGRIDDEVIAEFGEKLQYAVCEIMDILYRVDLMEKNPNDTNNASVKSMSSGGQSVSFNNNETEFDAAISSRKDQDRMILDRISEYLFDTGLLYKGA